MKRLLCAVMILLLLPWALGGLAEEDLVGAEVEDDAEITEAFPEDEDEADAPDIEPFTFRNGITWGMTKQEVLQTEGNPKYETDTDDATETIEIEDVEFGGAKCDLEYTFSDDDLFMVSVEYDTDEVNVSFDGLRSKLVERFGEPGAFSDDVKSELSEDALEELDTIASWTLEDGTEVWLMEDTDDQSIDIVFVDLGW